MQNFAKITRIFAFVAYFILSIPKFRIVFAKFILAKKCEILLFSRKFSFAVNPRTAPFSTVHSMRKIKLEKYLKGGVRKEKKAYGLWINHN